LVLADGRKYEGAWKNDLPNGFGTQANPDGTVYTGEWLAGKYNGQGKLTTADGGSYTGAWKDDLPHGIGTLIRPDGSKFSGEFRNGKAVEEGVLVSPEGKEKKVSM
jgi:hypothetical protein